MADWSSVDEYLETPDAPQAFEPNVLQYSDVARSPGRTLRPLDWLRVVDYEERGAPRRITPPPIFPTVVVLPTSGPTALPNPEDYGDETVVFEETNPPVFRPSTVPAPATSRPVPVIIAQPGEPAILPESEDDDVSVWTDLLGGFVGAGTDILTARYSQPARIATPTYTGVRQIVGGEPAPSATTVFGDATVTNPPVSQVTGGLSMQDCSTCPPGGPRYAKICIATGEVSPLRRRRRRRLFTAGDLRDIASLKAVVGGGAALNAAVVKAIR